MIFFICSPSGEPYTIKLAVSSGVSYCVDFGSEEIPCGYVREAELRDQIGTLGAFPTGGASKHEDYLGVANKLDFVHRGWG